MRREGFVEGYQGVVIQTSLHSQLQAYVSFSKARKQPKMSPSKVEPDVEEVERSKHLVGTDEPTTAGYAIESNELPKGYYLSPRFIGTFLAVGMKYVYPLATSYALLCSHVDCHLCPNAIGYTDRSFQSLVQHWWIRTYRSSSLADRYRAEPTRPTQPCNHLACSRLHNGPCSRSLARRTPQ